MLTPLLPSALLLITPFSPTLFNSPSCLTKGYLSTSGGQSIFSIEPSCLGEPNIEAGLEQGSLIPILPQTALQERSLVWIQQDAVDNSLWSNFQQEEQDGLDELFSRLSTPEPTTAEQQSFSTSNEFEILHRTASSALISVSASVARNIDTIVPRFYTSTLVPSTPQAFLPVPAPAVERVKKLLASLKFDPVIAALVNSLNVEQLRSDIRYLTGEDEASGIVSRHSFAEGSRVAASWLKEQFEATGAECELKLFLVGFAPNVICRYPSTSNTTALVLSSAHYDSRGSFGSTRAPGGDDDGSGVIALLSIARAIKENGIKFESAVELCAFAGEEQGLLGSKAYAKELREAGANITVMLQADMLGYRAPGEPPQLGLPDKIGTPEVAQLLWNTANIYSPELKVGYTPACCSDHQSFHEQGFPATHIFERAGPIVDPMYHNSGDLSDRPNYDFDQINSIAKVEFATLLHSAGFTFEEQEI